MVIDDAWYVMLAKALAEGRGYWLVNAPLDGILPGYPPGFPALLSLVFYLRPEFPDNIWLLKSVSIAAMLGVAWLSYFYLQRLRQQPRHLAALASVGIATTPALVFLATSTAMSECVFTLTQLGVVVLGHRASEASHARHEARRARRRARSGDRPDSLGRYRRRCGGVLCFAQRAPVEAAVGIHDRCRDRCRAMADVLARARAYRRAPADSSRVSRVRVRRSVLDAFRRLGVIRPSDGRGFAGPSGDQRDRCAGRSFVGIFAPILLRGADESGEEVVFLGGQVGWTFIGFGGLPRDHRGVVCAGRHRLWGFVRTVRERCDRGRVSRPDFAVDYRCCGPSGASASSCR